MLSVKTGTQAWTKSPQEQGFDVDRAQTLSSEDKQKLLGDQEFGDYLNKVADPNWVDPAKTRRVGNSEMGKDAFLKLLLAQLKNQDPTNPMQSHEMAAQLAQFSSLEKLDNIDTGISGLTKTQGAQGKFTALELIGKSVSGDSSEIVRNTGDRLHEVNYSLAKDASQVDVIIKDQFSQPVRKLQFTNIKPGRHEFSWNGMTEDGRTLPSGKYSVAIEAKDSQGKRVGVETAFSGVISGVNFTAEGPVLLVGNQSIKLSEIKKIVDPSQAALGPQVDSKMGDKEGAQKATVDQSIKPITQPSNLESVAMTSEMQSKLQKEALGGAP